jgi:hypothetical protein
MVCRFQGRFRAYRSISTIAHWKPTAPPVSRPLRSHVMPIVYSAPERAASTHDENPSQVLNQAKLR